MEKENQRSEIRGLYRRLLRAARHRMTENDLELLRKAFGVADRVCRLLKEEETETDLIRVLNIALILVNEFGMGMVSATSALLLFSHLDPSVNKIYLKKEFGQQVQLIVDGLSKIASIDTRKTFSQPENLRKLVLNLAADIRVILIKIAERLYDMRNLPQLPLDRQLMVAFEAFYIYSPLAHRLGLYPVKTEMEDRYLLFTEPRTFAAIEKKIRESALEREQYIAEFVKPLRARLRKENFKFRILGRTKSVFSIWSKMQRQGVDFDEVYDLFAIRIILETRPEQEKADCWHVYSVVTDFYQPNPQRLRDWISIPKSNGYESLHTTVVGPGGKWVEVQIRTERMDELAEKGVAAHWKYKEGGREKDMDAWLVQMREMLESSPAETADYAEELIRNLYTDEVFVFTPKGELKRLRTGSTVLDFAYDIHTDIGYHCVGARVNRKNVPLKYELVNGDEVHILTSNSQKPKPDWLNMVVTTKARNKIRQALNEEKFKAAEAGKEMLQRRFRNWKIPYNDENIKKLLARFKLKTAQDLYALIFQEKIDLAEVKELFMQQPEPEKAPAPSKTPEPEEKQPPVTRLMEGEDFLLVDDNVDGLKYQLARCCNPIFGDEIFGFVTVNEGIKIHRLNCPNAAEMIRRYGYRVVKASWKKNYESSSFQTVVRVTGVDELGMVNRLSEVLSKDLKVNMRSISVESKDGFFEGIITLFVTSKSHLEGVLHRLMRVKGVQRAVRVDEFDARKS